MTEAVSRPMGLPDCAIRQLRKFAKTRERLYHLMLAWSLCAFAIGSLVPVDAIEPGTIPRLMAFVIPGLPERLVDVVTKRPVVAVILLGVYMLIRRASFLVKAAEADYAFQACQGVSILEPSAFVRGVGKVVPTVWLTWPVVIGFALLISLDLFCRPTHAADVLCTPGTPAETAVGSANTYNLRRLASGEKVQVTIRSDRVRNETGVWLEKDVTYTARYTGSCDWRDKEIKAPPQGFQFDLNCLRWHRFWWLEWMRPYPKGVWFQVIGRIDHGHNVFPILDGKDAGKPYELGHTVSGELVLLVNDVIYGNNHGVMTIELCRCGDDEMAAE